MTATRRLLAITVATLTMLLGIVAFAGASNAAPGAGYNGVASTCTVTSSSSGSLSCNHFKPNTNICYGVGAPGNTPLGTTNGSGSVSAGMPKNTSTSSETIYVGPCNGTAGEFASVTVSGTGHQSNNGNAGLASTGVAVIGIGALGVVLLVGGALMLLAGRRRKLSS